MRKFLLLLFTVPAFACTDFIVKAQDGDAVVGRSMEFGLDMHSDVLFFPAGTSMQSQVFNGQTGLKWQVRYPFVGLNAFGQNWLVDGMNAQGLSIGGLWFPDSIYPKVNQSNPSNVIALEDVANWLLATCATIEDVKQAIPKVQIWAHEIAAIKQIPPLHLSIHDKSGKSIAIEFLNGKPDIIENPVGVLTNAPKLTWHLTNLNNFINLSAMQKGEVSFDGMVLKAGGQGFGMLGLPGDWTPPSRFVRIANFKNFANPAANAKQNINLAFHLLNTVDIPYGLVRNENPEHYDYTQWIIVKDLTTGDFFIRTYENLDILSFNLQQLLKKNPQGGHIPISGTGQ